MSDASVQATTVSFIIRLLESSRHRDAVEGGMTHLDHGTPSAPRCRAIMRTESPTP